MLTIDFFPSAWRSFLTHPLVLGIMFLLPALFFLQPMPIDETRYLAVAWEMRQTGNFLVPHLNGEWYSHKPPLLFWLINLGWLIAGVHAWVARAMILLCSVASLLLLKSVALRLGATRSAAHTTMWILVGAFYFAAFANAIMFDVLLSTCVLATMLGLLDIEQGDKRRGILLMGTALGLGILAKGPVMLLDVCFAVLTAPWWSDKVRANAGAFFTAVGLSVLLGVLIALAWAIPAAIYGGSEYAHAIFLHQTVDRMAQSFAHRRPLWWYLWVLPIMLLPWSFVLRLTSINFKFRTNNTHSAQSAMSNAMPSGDEQEQRITRFTLGWVVPTFIVFSLISGKQPHYLLPLFPGVALLLGFALARNKLTVRVGLFGLLLLAVGALLASLPYFAMRDPKLELLAPIWPLWGLLIAACGLTLVIFRNHFSAPAVPAIACLIVVLVGKCALVQGLGPRYDMRAIATQVKAAQDRGQAIVHLGWHHGVYEFAGRLNKPLPTITPDKLADFAREHPDALVISFYKRFRFPATPIYRQPFRGGSVAIWHIQDALSANTDSINGSQKEDGELLPAEDSEQNE